MQQTGSIGFALTHYIINKEFLEVAKERRKCQKNLLISLAVLPTSATGVELLPNQPENQPLLLDAFSFMSNFAA